MERKEISFKEALENAEIVSGWDERTLCKNASISNCAIEYEVATEIRFEDSDFSKSLFANFRFQDCEFYNCDFRHATFNRCDFVKCTFHNCDMTETVTDHDSRIANCIFNRCNISNADVTYTKVFNSEFSDCVIRDAIMWQHTGFGEIKLKNTDILGSRFDNASIGDVYADNRTKGFFQICPPKGVPYMGYFMRDGYPYVFEIEIQPESERFSSTTRVCRASKAVVYSIEDVNTQEKFSLVTVSPAEFYSKGSFWNETNGIKNYKDIFVGEIISVRMFNGNRYNIFDGGIWHYLTKQEAIDAWKKGKELLEALETEEQQ